MDPALATLNPPMAWLKWPAGLQKDRSEQPQQHVQATNIENEDVKKQNVPHYSIDNPQHDFFFPSQSRPA